MRRRRRLMHRRHDVLVGLRSGDGEHVRVLLADDLGLGAEAAGDDDAAVLGHGVADRLERLVAGRIQEPACVDDDQVGAVMLAGDLVAFGAQPCDDALGVDQRLRASEADETDAWGGGHGFVLPVFQQQDPAKLQAVRARSCGKQRLEQDGDSEVILPYGAGHLS